MHSKQLLRVAMLLVFILAGCGSVSQERPTPVTAPVFPTFTPVQPAAPEYGGMPIPIVGPVPRAADTTVTVLPPEAELSGLAWYGDHLILLPQYPDFALAETGTPMVFAIDKASILTFIDGEQLTNLVPQSIAFEDGGLEEQIDGFEGYEAIAFDGDRAFLTIEAATDTGMRGYLVRGTIAPDLTSLTLDATTLAEIPPQTDVGNMAYETLLVADETLVTIYEANGGSLNVAPVAHLLGLGLNPRGTIPFPNIEYRITDVTALDANNRFWAINYFFPGDEALVPPFDPLAEGYRLGFTHSQYDHVERLVEFAYDEAGISRVDRAPLQLRLDEAANNWEGIVRLDDRGFLMVTDRFPDTLLSFVAIDGSGM